MHCIGGCNRITASLGRQRHDMVVNALNSILRADAGVNTVLEPMARGPVGRGDSRRRQDFKPGSAELDGPALDVGIASPTTATAIRLQHADTTHLVAAKALEAAKRAKYDGIEPGARFLPVVFENTGAPGDHARSVLKTIAIEVQRHATETGMALALWRAAQLVLRLPCTTETGS